MYWSGNLLTQKVFTWYIWCFPSGFRREAFLLRSRHDACCCLMMYSVHEIQCFCGRDAQLGIDVLSIKIDIFRSCDSISVICDTALLIFQVFELILRQLFHYLLKICHSSQSTKLWVYIFICLLTRTLGHVLYLQANNALWIEMD